MELVEQNFVSGTISSAKMQQSTRFGALDEWTTEDPQ